ncbi:Uncharacterised protein [Staphylococcus chromogenes]|nr:Uncharacterised protein [Staphylococcus chromogenes]
MISMNLIIPILVLLLIMLIGYAFARWFLR